MTEVPELTPQKYYRLPWSLTDNGISWLEVTTSCNLACEGCYRPNEKNGHKTLQQVADDLAVFKKHRKTECMSIAGGDPLVHPQIVDIVRMISEGGWKPILNTNGLALTPELLRDLKRAGVRGFTFHVDTTQKRRDSKFATESGHNALRQKFADMLAAEGGVCCSFNQTVSAETLHEIPDVVRWARERPDIVHTVVFILFRTPHVSGDFDFYANGRRIDIDGTYDKTRRAAKPLKAKDVVAKIREVEPDFEPNSYLSGTIDPMSTKWLIATRVADRRGSLGYAGARFMEIVQNFNHLLKGRWLSYSSPEFLARGRLAALVLSPFDRGMRGVIKRYAAGAMRNPARFFERAYLQTFTVIQPIDILEDGGMNMCDGCPDITVHNGKFYWSCRLEEIKTYGAFVAAVPKTRNVGAAGVYGEEIPLPSELKPPADQSPFLWSSAASPE